jgi:hypothetical protein
MSNTWNLSIIRKLAGLPPAEPKKPLTEGFHDDDMDDDEDRDVAIANSDKKQAAFEKRNKKELSSAEKEAAEMKKAKKPAAKKEEPKKAPAAAKFVHGKGFVKDDEPAAEKKTPAPSKEVAAKKPVAKSAEQEMKKDQAVPKSSPADVEAKKRGRAQSDDSKSGQARSWLTHADNKGHTRGGFIKHATANLGMSAHHANTFYYAHKKKNAAGEPLKEGYVIYHPHLASFMLAENREMNQMQWIDPTSPLEPCIFETQEEAEKIAKYMREWKNQNAQVVKVSFEE